VLCVTECFCIIKTDNSSSKNVKIKKKLKKLFQIKNKKVIANKKQKKVISNKKNKKKLFQIKKQKKSYCK